MPLSQQGRYYHVDPAIALYRSPGRYRRAEPFSRTQGVYHRPAALSRPPCSPPATGP